MCFKNSKFFVIVFRPETLTFQAMSESDRRLWMDAMDGKEPVCSLVDDLSPLNVLCYTKAFSIQIIFYYILNLLSLFS